MIFADSSHLISNVLRTIHYIVNMILGCRMKNNFSTFGNILKHNRINIFIDLMVITKYIPTTSLDSNTNQIYSESLYLTMIIQKEISESLWYKHPLFPCPFINNKVFRIFGIENCSSGQDRVAMSSIGGCNECCSSH